MTLSTEAAIERIALGLIDRTLPRADWTHEGHFAAALWLCRYRRDLAEPEEIRSLISSYNEATNTANTDTSGYHHTITLSSLRAAADHLARHGKETPLAPLLSALMASELGDPAWLLAYWSRDLLFSVQARRSWIEPDLSPLPF